MPLDELVLKIPSEGDIPLESNRHEEAATNLNMTVSQEVKHKESLSQHKGNQSSAAASTSRGHSRESSGTSNLSVKFTIEREGGNQSSITESVSVCSTPQQLSPNPNLAVQSLSCSKPPHGASTSSTGAKSANVRRKRSRKSLDSSEHDSGAISGSNSVANDDFQNELASEDDLDDGEGTTTDELSDEGNRVNQCDNANKPQRNISFNTVPTLVSSGSNVKIMKANIVGLENRISNNSDSSGGDNAEESGKHLTGAKR